MNDCISRRYFGIEIESHPVLSSDEILEIIRSVSSKEIFFSGWQQTHSNNSYWHLKTDSTCGGGEKFGWELASYKGSGLEDIEHVSDVANCLGKSGLYCGNDCGFHVHVDLSDFKIEQAAVLLARWVKIEKLMLESVPRFRSHNRHCRSIRNKISPKNKYQDPLSFWEKYKPKNFSLHNNRDKKVTLNLVNYATCLLYDCEFLERDVYCDSSRRTAEFRFPEATFKKEDIKNWIILFVKFVDFSKKSEMPNNLTSVRKVKEFFDILGFPDEMTSLKLWLCERISKNAFSKKWRKTFQNICSKK